MAVKERETKREKLDIFSVKLPHQINLNIRNYCKRKGIKITHFAAVAFNSALLSAEEEEQVLGYYRLQKEKESAVDFHMLAEKYSLKDRYFTNGKQRKEKIK